MEDVKLFQNVNPGFEKLPPGWDAVTSFTNITDLFKPIMEAKLFAFSMSMELF